MVKYFTLLELFSFLKSLRSAQSKAVLNIKCLQVLIFFNSVNESSKVLIQS